MSKYLDVNILALLPCPLKTQLEKLLVEKIKEISDKTGENISYKIVSNAVMQENVFEKISEMKSSDDFPDVILAPGIGKFFHKDFIENFRNKGCFESVNKTQESALFKTVGLYDPQNYYDIVAFNPLVFLVDKTRVPDLPTPKSWLELTNSCYEHRVSYRGKDDRSFCEGVLFPVYELGGEEAIAKLGKSVKSRLHPAEMVKLSGMKKDESPDVSVIPVSFAKMIKPNSNLEVVYPKEGASINPIVLLTKSDASEGLKEFSRFLLSPQIGELFSKVGFIHEANATEEETSKPYAWSGWEFIFNNSVGELNAHLNDIMYEHTAEIRKNATHNPHKQHKHGQGCCTCD